MNRVVITGLGAVSPLGNTFEESWTAAKSGKSGIGPITKFDVSDIPWKVSGELKGFNAYPYLTGKELRRLDPFIHYAVAASIMAVEDAGLLQMRPDKGPGKRDITDPYFHEAAHVYLASGGVVIGSSRGGISTIEKAFAKDRRPGLNRSRLSSVSAYLMPATTISMASSYVAQKLGIKGYCLGISNACASGTSSIGEAYRLIRAGFKGSVLTGGSEAPVCRLCVEGYGISGALSETADISASRPFDKTRDGFVIAEGACVIVLENMENALGRGSKIYGEIIGYANTVDALHQTRPDGEGEARAFMSAIVDAGLKPADIDYISSHGTATPLGDRVESEALEKVFEERVSAVPVSAVKSMTGHMLAASGAIETAFTIMSIKEGIIPPTINLTEKDRACAVNVITEMMETEIGIALSSSFGFGGINAVIVLRGFPESE